MRILLLFIAAWLAMPSFAQESVRLSGIVKNSKGEQIPGVNVFVKKNQKLGTVTDTAGRFLLKVPLGSTVVFTFVGYDVFEYKATGSADMLVIELKEGDHNIDEVVISTGVGGQQRKISVVGAISTVDPKELQVPGTQLSNMLGGRLAGVISLQSSGEPGKNIADFWVRGISTFGANSRALVLIDGLEGDLNSIDPADVETFSVLKDASATAVYGVRGANGVVLITTKKGGQSKLQITARVNYTLSLLKRMPRYMGAYEYAKLANEARVVRGDQPIYSPQELEIIEYGLDMDLFPDVNWQKEIIKPYGIQQTYYASARGGGSVVSYFLSLGTAQESAAYRLDPSSPYKSNSGYNTYTYRSNLDMKLTNRTKLYFGTEGFLDRRMQPGIANTNDLWAAQSQLTPLLIPKVYSSGQLPAYGTGANYSPYVMLNYTGRSSSQRNNFMATLALYQNLEDIVKGLTWRVQGAFNSNNDFNERRWVLPRMFYASSRAVDGSLQLIKKLDPITANYSYGQQQYRRYHLESTINYERVFEKVHRFSALAYYYMQDSKGTSGLSNSLSAISLRYQGLSGRLTYGYNDTYMVDLNFGYTGSENFQRGRRFGFFPSIAGGWVPTSYEWVKKQLPWLNFIKFRGSYGIVGNDRISNKRFPYLTIINENAGAGWGSTVGGINESNIGADNLRWERSIKANLGIDARMFKDKFSFTIDIFRDVRDGIFQQRTQIPDYAGLLQMPYGNVGAMESFGTDGNFAFQQSINEKLSFVIRGNFTYSENMVNNWEMADPKYDYQRISGYPLNVVRGYLATGLFRDEQDVESSPKQVFGSKVMPGDIKYKDVNGDGTINSDDRVVISYTNYPRLMFGIGGQISYKNLSVGILFKGTGRNYFYHVGNGAGMGYMPFFNNEVGNVLTMFANPNSRWIPASYSGTPATENPDAKFPRLTYGYNANNSQLSTYWKRDARYIRLQEITLSYRLNTNVLKKLGLKSVDLQLIGYNIYSWDKVRMWDPEQASSNGRSYPIPARYTFQAYFNF